MASDFLGWLVGGRSVMWHVPCDQLILSGTYSLRERISGQLAGILGGTFSLQSGATGGLGRNMRGLNGVYFGGDAICAFTSIGNPGIRNKTLVVACHPQDSGQGAVLNTKSTYEDKGELLSVGWALTVTTAEVRFQGWGGGGTPVISGSISFSAISRPLVVVVTGSNSTNPHLSLYAGSQKAVADGQEPSEGLAIRLSAQWNGYDYGYYKGTIIEAACINACLSEADVLDGMAAFENDPRSAFNIRGL